MRDTFYRLTDPILDRIPDISHLPPRRQVSIGIVASILFHALLLLFALFVGLFLPDRSLISFAKAKPQLQEIELTIVPPVPKEEEEMRLVTMEDIQNPRPFIDSRGLAPSTKAPEKGVFESDVDMVAASELPASGNLPLPTQEGKAGREFPAFSTHQVLLGKTAVPFPLDVSLTQPPPTPKEPAEPAKPAEAEPPAPEATPPPKLTTPADEAKWARDEEIALAKTRPATPAPVSDIPKPKPPVAMPAMRTTAPLAMLSSPVPQSRPPPNAYQPQQEKTRIEGRITNKGRNAVDAVGTPLGRYKKAVYDAVGSRWYFYTSKKTDLIAPGSVRVSFSIDAQGRAVGVKSENNTSNPSFSDLCERAVRDAEIAPPPPDLMEPLLDGRLDFSITFTFHTF